MSILGIRLSGWTLTVRRAASVARLFRWRLVPAFLALVAAVGAVACSSGSGEDAASQSQALSTTSLSVSVLTNSCGATQAQYFLQVTNTGTASVKLSDIAIKFWVDDTSGSSVVAAVNTGGCVSNVNGNPSCTHQVTGVDASATSFSPACGPDPSHQADWEITISDTDGSLLPPGATWTNTQAALHLASFGTFTPGVGSWYSSCAPGSSYATNPRFAVYFQGAAVTGSGQPPICRRPHGVQQLSGYVPAAVATAPFLGAVPPTAQIRLSVGLPLVNPGGMQTQLEQLYNPFSPQYRKFLSPAQFAASYGPSTSDYQTLITFLQSQGLTVTKTYTSRQLVDVMGTAAAVENTFFVFLNSYQRPDGTSFYAPDGEPSLALPAPLLVRVNGLDSFDQPKHSNGSGPLDPTFMTNLYTGADIRNAYVPGETLTGNGQTVALVEFDGFVPSDITGYEKQSTPNLPNVPVTPVPIDGFNGDTSVNQDEVTLDIDMAIAMAPGLDNVLVYSAAFPGEFGPAYDAAADDVLTAVANATPLSRQISCSWFGFGGDNVAAAISQFALQGQSFFFASGDQGAFGAPPLAALPRPQSESEMSLTTLVGGTQLTTGSGASYTSETTWNDQFKDRGFGGASSGGAVPGVPIPAYQAPFASVISAAGGDATVRNFPDVAFLATDIEYMLNGVEGPVSGTSAAAPLWAGFAALVNQQASANGLGPLGFANPALYAIAQGPNYADEFHDVVSGTDNFSGVAPFAAGTGYDLTTGFGTPRDALINDLAGLTSAPSLGISVGFSDACAIRAQGFLSCWGANTFGELGNGNTTEQNLPVQVPGLSGVVSVGVGEFSTCAALSDGTVDCWGSNVFGQLGDGTTTNRSSPVQVQGITNAVAVAVSGEMACAVLSTGAIACWGEGDLGDGANHTTPTTPPVTVQGITNAASLHISKTETEACAILSTGALECWGGNDNGQLGDGTQTDRLAPVPITLSAKAVDVSIGTVTTCAALSDGTVDCWGGNATFGGLLGDNGAENFRLTPGPVPGLTGATAVDVGDVSACAVVANGALECWGFDGEGELGDGTTNTSGVPVPVVDLAGATDVEGGSGATCALLSNGAVECWGENGLGSLGNGSTTPSSVPTAVRFQ